MQWTADGGFSAGRPWIGPPRCGAEVNAASQLGDPDSVLSLYRALIALRREHPAFRGAFRRLEAGHPAVYAYERGEPGPAAETLVVAANLSGAPARTSLAAPGEGQVVLATGPVAPDTPLTLPPWTGVVFRPGFRVPRRAARASGG
ncbi:MAG: DUF3459 domain-containing protein [Bifidobacteriaceae bacterium]|jgi:alpha-glucosidase|nr:DUF3459 domain-containing protein [Bifidobacteriaceae bacterium]